MRNRGLPVYDISSIEKTPQKDLLAQPLNRYLNEHYHHLHRPHRHSFYHLVYFTAGEGSFTIDFDKFRLEPFQVYFMIPGQAHSWHFTGDVHGYIVHFNASLFDGFLKDPDYLHRFGFFKGIAAQSVLSVTADKRTALTAIFEEIIFEAAGQTSTGLDMLRIKLVELFLRMAGNTADENLYNRPIKKHTVLQNFQQLVNQQFEKLKLPKEYAELLHITPNHLNAICVELVGKTAGTLIRERIMLEAKRLLTNADMTVSEIAYGLGFQDNSYFNRFFRKETGLTPENFRQQFINS
jgi:AraC family transcriptional regulator, transcriptional activator of pobA